MILLIALVDHSTANRRPILLRGESGILGIGQEVQRAYEVHCAKYGKTPVWKDVELKSITFVADLPRRKKGERR